MIPIELPLLHYICSFIQNLPLVKVEHSAGWLRKQCFLSGFRERYFSEDVNDSQLRKNLNDIIISMCLVILI